MDILDDIDEAIEKAERKKYPHEDWCVYVPTERLDEVHDVQVNRSPMEVYDKGEKVRERKIIPDHLVDEPIILPDKPSDIPGFETFENPPEYLIEKVVDVESNTYREEYHDSKTRVYTTWAFFDLVNEHRRINREKVDKYNFFGVSGEYDEEPDVLERLKFGYQISVSAVFDDIPEDYHRNAELFETIRENIHNVSRSPVYEWRKRTIKGAYPVLDITHHEKIRVGTEYKHYGGLLLKNIDTRTKKIEMPSSPDTLPFE